jgi:putative DNA primase/helicase
MIIPETSLASQNYQPPEARKRFSPEARASYLSWKFGGTLDWCSAILREINYPVAELRWFVDAVQGLCKGKEMRIAHSTLAKRAQRFTNKAQASDLARRAIEANNEWARNHLRLVFDIERPRPGEMEGKDKRARTRYTDYLTPAAVWAQETEHKVKKSDEVKWKEDSKEKRQEILREAVKMLPQFGNVADMPGVTPKDPQPLSLSEYVKQREKIILAENNRILGRLCEPSDQITVEDIDERLAILDVTHEKAIHEIEKSYQSARAVLLGLKKTRLTRAMNFTDTEQVMAKFDARREEGRENAGIALNWLEETFQEFAPKDEKKGKTHDPLVEAAEALQRGSSSDGYVNSKGVARLTLSGTVSETVDGEIEEFIVEDAPAPMTQLDCALNYARTGVPVFPVKPDKKPYTEHGFKDATTDERAIRDWWKKHPDAGIGAPTGKATGWLVLDIDPDKGGDASLSEFVLQHGDLPRTQCARTPRNGQHFFFKYPTHIEVRNSESKIGKGLDIRGTGGYVVLPGADSARTWIDMTPPVDAPDAIVEAATSKKHEPINTDSKKICQAFTGARFYDVGERNKGLLKLACGWWRNGLVEDVQELYDRLLDARATRCAQGKDSPATDEQLLDMAQRTATKYARGLKQTVTTT